MPEAARVGDPIAHTQAMSGLLIGLAAGAALAVVTVATGGLGGVIVAAAIAGGAAGGGLAGAYIGETIMGSPSGAVAVGSPNVFINGRPAGLVLMGTANCTEESGAPVPVAQGSDSVFINGMPAARKGDKLVCSAVILEGSANVLIGGPDSVTYIEMEPEVPPWLTTSLTVVALGSMLVLGGGAVLTAGWAVTLAGLGGGLIGANLAARGARQLGEALGWSETTIRSLEVASGFAGGMAGGAAAARGAAWFNSRYRITTEGLGSNFGNVRISRRPVLPHNTGGKTSGVLRSANEDIPLESGVKGPAQSMPKGTPGMNIVTKTHVEGHAAAVMRQRGLSEAELFINKAPCGGVRGCEAMLPKMLPESAKLRVSGPGGYDRVFTGLPD